MRYAPALAAALLGLALGGCGGEPRDLAGIRDSGEIRVAVIEGPSVFYEGPLAPRGFEYELAERFAAHLGVRPVFQRHASEADMLEAVAGGDADLGMAAVAGAGFDEPSLLAAPGHYPVRPLVACHVTTAGRVAAGAELAVVGIPGLREDWLGDTSDLDLPAPVRELDDEDAESVLARIAEAGEGCALTDSATFGAVGRYYPRLVVLRPAGEPRERGWVTRRDAPRLAARVAEWLEDADREGVMAALTARYFALGDGFDYFDRNAVVRRIDSRLPRFRPLFERAAAETGLPWKLIAAQAYQESHWNPEARSPTGVRGIMMLTQATARELGVTNRMDPEQSILGGARYLARLRDRLPAEVEGADRLWLALAAYSVGFGHLQDARALALESGADPDRWASHKVLLPRLSERRFSRRLPGGYAPGRAAVHYDERIRDYLDIIDRRLADQAAVAGS